MMNFRAGHVDFQLAVAIAQVRHGYRANPRFALETARIDALPHQLIAVYQHLLPQTQLRFLLADDPGAGKTIMAGLYLSEMRLRRKVQRALIIAPAGLVGNWRRELASLFNLRARIVKGEDFTHGNPFMGEGSELVIISLDTMAGDRALGRLGEAEVDPYDLAIFDEAHKLSASFEQEIYTKRTSRYKLAEILAGAETEGHPVGPTWRPRHLLLMTATPHMGKDDPYYFLWRLLEPTLLSTKQAFDAFSREERGKRYLRRTKEELVGFDAKPLFVTRRSDTITYPLSAGPHGEQALYDAVTSYLDTDYNKAAILNTEAARLARGVYQRRLASSTFAVLRSLERRQQTLGVLIEKVQVWLDGRGAMSDEGDTTGLSESDGDDADDADINDRGPLSQIKTKGSARQVLIDLVAEQRVVAGLVMQAQRVANQQSESKYRELQRFLENPAYAREKVIVFSEFRDTVTFLERRLAASGFTDRIARVDGSMDYQARDSAVEFFRRDHIDGDGAQYLLATDAAGEGINLQFCWLTINYDLPWNPARLEQRMGRIHRYGQKHDPVLIVNLLAAETREGRVFKVLLDKLELIRRQLGSDKVFDVIGRLFTEISVVDYLNARRGTDEALLEQLGGQLNEDQVRALVARVTSEREAVSPTIASQLPAMVEDRRRQALRRLLPGSLRRIIPQGASRLGLTLSGDIGGLFALEGQLPAALAEALQLHGPEARKRLSLTAANTAGADAVWVHPGEPVGDALLEVISEAIAPSAMVGAVMVDPTTTEPYTAVVAVTTVAERTPDGRVTTAGSWVDAVAVNDSRVWRISDDHIDRWVAADLPAATNARERFAASATTWSARAMAHLTEVVAHDRTEARRQDQRATVPAREQQLIAGFAIEEQVIAELRSRLREPLQRNEIRARVENDRLRDRHRTLESRRAQSIASLHAEAEAFHATPSQIIATALLIPPPLSPASSDAVISDGVAVEATAMATAMDFEVAHGATVHDVSTPDLARAAGLPEWPGFDLWSERPEGTRAIEVKGRARRGGITMTNNEWTRAATLGTDYWLYVVFDAATPVPSLYRFCDPTHLLPAQVGSVTLSESDLNAHANQDDV